MDDEVGNEEKAERSDEVRLRETAAEAERWETQQRAADWRSLSGVADCRWWGKWQLFRTGETNVLGFIQKILKAEFLPTSREECFLLDKVASPLFLHKFDS